MRYLVYSGSNFAEKYVVTEAEVGEEGGGERGGGVRGGERGDIFLLSSSLLF